MLPAGAACEHPQERGAALLRLSQLRGDLNAGLTREIALLGGELKAWLEPEFAVYQLRLPQEKLEPALEALKVQLLTPLDPQQLLRLRPALDAQQAALRKDPRRGELEALLAALLPEHPLGRPLLPSSAELTRLNLKRIESFRLRCETPQGSLMSLSGALKPKELLDILERTFTLWRGPSRPRLPPLKLSPPSLELHAAPSPQLFLASLLPELEPEELLGLDLLALLLQARVGLRAYPIPLAKGAAFVLEAEGASLDLLWDRSLLALHALRLISPTELRALSLPAGGLARLSSFQSRFGRQAERPGVKELEALAQRLLQPQGFAARLSSPQKVDRQLWAERLLERLKSLSQQPAESSALGRMELGRLREAQIHQLPGEEILLRADLLGGLALEPIHQPGVAALLARSLARSWSEGSLSVRLEPEQLSLTLRCAPDHLPEALRELQRRLTEPPTLESLELARAALLREVEERNLNLDRRLHQLLQRAQGGREPLGSSASIQELGPSDLAIAFELLVHRAPLRLWALGPLDPARVRLQLRGFMGDALSPQRPQSPTQAKLALRRSQDPLSRWQGVWRLSIKHLEEISGLRLLVEVLAGVEGRLRRSLLKDLGAECKLVMETEAREEEALLYIKLSAPPAQLEGAIGRLKTELERLSKLELPEAEFEAYQRRAQAQSGLKLEDLEQRAVWLSEMRRLGQPLEGSKGPRRWRASFARLNPPSFQALVKRLEFLRSVRQIAERGGS